VHCGERVAQLPGQLRDLEARVGGVVAAVEEEVADVVRAEDLDQALVFARILVEFLELVAGAAEGPAGGVLERADGGGRFPAVSMSSSCSAPEDPVPAA
jgi:hypothetical protein